MCGRQLKNRENVPVLGWVLARGRTKCCQQSIPVHYVVAELVGGVGWGLVVALLGSPWGFVVAALLTTAVTWWYTRRAIASRRAIA